MTKRSTTVSPVSNRRKWSRTAIAASIMIVAAASILLLPSRIGKNGPDSSSTSNAPAPMFTKHGFATFMNERNEFITRFDIEIAADELSRELGLMGRPVMEDGQGMLFIFGEERPVSFWMKNTILPLDMVMINERREVVTIHKNTTPFSEQEYPSTGPVKYVLELNAGITDRFGIKVGDRISWQRNE